MAPEMTTQRVVVTRPIGKYRVYGIKTGALVVGFESLEEARQFQTEHGGMILCAHKGSKTKKRHRLRMSEAGLKLTRALYPYVVELKH